jgi:60S ribosome subunit biogenesis protein NIP7
MKQAISIARPQLISLGTCFGRFSKSGKFKLAVTSLDWLGKYAKFKVSSSSPVYRTSCRPAS